MNDLSKSEKSLLLKARTCQKCKLINGGITEEYVKKIYGISRDVDSMPRPPHATMVIAICPKCNHKWGL